MLGWYFDDHGGITHIHGHIHRSPVPQTQEHARAIAEAGIRTVFSMEHSTPGHLLEAEGLTWRPHFWTDDQPPTYDEVDAFLADFEKHAHDPVLVHCRMGWGRAGTAITCALVKQGLPTEEALRTFWRQVPYAEKVMTRTGQAAFVRGYAARLKGRGIVP